MMNDSVREELRDKISPIARTAETAPECARAVMPAPLPFMPAPRPAAPAPDPIAAAEPQVRTHTAEIMAKPTSPTLVDFQNKNAALPDWRLELQNAVRKRRENIAIAQSTGAPVTAVSTTVLQTNGSAAVKAEVVAYEAPPADEKNDRLEGALKRIEESRRRFLNGESSAPAPAAAAPAMKSEPSSSAHMPAKSYPFYIATKNAEVLPKPAIAPPAALAPRPVIEELPIIAKKELDTNKLRPLPNASIISSSIEKAQSVGLIDDLSDEEPGIISISRAADAIDDEVAEYEEVESEFEEVEDVAPLAMRFNAAVFDLVIGAGASLILLAPLMISGGRWLSLAGALAYGVTLAIVLFIYLTTAIGFFGQTFGMKMLGLEVLDIEEEDYPTLHQAAVNSSVYIVSLAFGGLGLLPALFNDERRAAHDLLSGTIVVREEC